MTVTIAQLSESQHEYLAYCKSLCGKATYLVYFGDSIVGAVALHNFIDMLRSFFDLKSVDVVVSEHTCSPKNEWIMDMIKP